jgi:hypothetical protein
MKTIVAATAALLLFSGAPAMAMSCCGGGKGKAPMCGKGSMVTNQGSTKGKKSGCCCEGMSGGNMSKRT